MGHYRESFTNQMLITKRMCQFSTRRSLFTGLFLLLSLDVELPRMTGIQQKYNSNSKCVLSAKGILKPILKPYKPELFSYLQTIKKRK